MAEQLKKSKRKASPADRMPIPGPGRPKGSKNKFTSLKDSFLEAFEALGGTEGLIAWAKKSERNKAVFYGWITKMLPTNVDLGGYANILFRVIYDPEAKDK